MRLSMIQNEYNTILELNENNVSNKLTGFYNALQNSFIDTF